MAKKEYAHDFFETLSTGVTTSAAATLPHITKLINPRSVIDLGCGDGGWLKVFQALGVREIVGVEGEYVKSVETQIPKEAYKFHDLTKKFSMDRRFDIAMSLEVAEHLPPQSGELLVESLCELSDIVIFSAAITGQEGTLHINEQFPEYWAKRFEKYGYLPVDYLRPKIWSNDKVEPWYKQNIILYVNREISDTLPSELRACQQETHAHYLFRIHPEMYLNMLKRKYPFHFANYWWNRLKRYFKKY